MKLRVAVEVECEVKNIAEAAAAASVLKQDCAKHGTVTKWAEKVLNR